VNSKYLKYFIFIFIAFASSFSYSKSLDYDSLLISDTIKYEPSFFSTFQLKDRYSDPYSNLFSNTAYDINSSILKISSYYDTAKVFFVSEKMGSLYYRPPIGIPFNKFDKYNTDSQIKNYFKEKSIGLDGENTLESGRLIPKIFIPQSLDRIFGGNYIDLQVNGFVNLDFGGRFQRIENPSIPIRQQKNGGFNYDQQINLSIDGKVGEKLKITANFDNNNTFDFQNNLKLDYTGYDEDIIKKIEVGNISMPVRNSLLRGGLSLFGLKTQLQFGRLSLTGILSRQQGKSESIKVKNGFQGREFEIIASDYDENRHFFLGHYFRDNYEK
jgi:cell surface protein SprA